MFNMVIILTCQISCTFFDALMFLSQSPVACYTLVTRTTQRQKKKEEHICWVLGVEGYVFDWPRI